MIRSRWKKQAIEQMPEVLGDRRARREKSEEELKAQLYQEIGQLKVELDWLKKSWPHRLIPGEDGSKWITHQSASAGNVS